MPFCVTFNCEKVSMEGVGLILSETLLILRQKEQKLEQLVST